MNARVFLLVLVTAAFMAVWDADRPAAARVALNQKRSDQSVASVSPACRGLIPLPTDLQTGTWQVFNHDGDTCRITIECRKSESIAASTEARVVTGSNGIRWCFIKEQPDTAHLAEAIRQ